MASQDILNQLVNATTELNNTVRDKTVEIDQKVDESIGRNNSETDNAINNLTNKVQSELNLLKGSLTNDSWFSELSSPIRIYGAEVIGNPWDDDLRSGNYISSTSVNPVIWSNENSAFIPNESINENPFYKLGCLPNATNEYDSDKAQEWLAGDNPTGYGLGSAYSPVKRHRNTKKKLVRGDGTFYKCFNDFSLVAKPFHAAGIQFKESPTQEYQKGLQPYLVLTGSISGTTDVIHRTFVSVHDDSTNGGTTTHTGTGSNTTGWTRAWARPRTTSRLTGDGFTGIIEKGDPLHSTGLISVIGASYNAAGNAYAGAGLMDPTAGGTKEPTPNEFIRWGNYNMTVLVPLRHHLFTSGRFRLINWGYADLVVHGYGVVYMPKIQK